MIDESLARENDPKSQDYQYNRGYRQGEYEGYRGEPFDHQHFERVGFDRAAGYANGHAAGRKKLQEKEAQDAQD